MYQIAPATYSPVEIGIPSGSMSAVKSASRRRFTPIRTQPSFSGHSISGSSPRNRYDLTARPSPPARVMKPTT